ncbi:GIY-YIG nuclease family protein [Mesorhizobium escarrei]|nr:GIY-YIG nuclease family protein [Mesorhizobium escarrei]
MQRPRTALASATTMAGYAYMTASLKRGMIYIGVTNDLGRRMPEHKSGQGSLHQRLRRAATTEDARAR